MAHVEQIRQILSTRDLTLYRLSHMSARMFGRASRYYIPHNFYSDVADPCFTPHIEQMLSFSHITNYRLADWLAVFGVSLDRISALQLSLRSRHTTLADSAVYDTQAWIPWFFELPRSSPIPAVAPLAQILGFAQPKRAGELLALAKRKFLYGRIGEDDIYSSPQVAAGSIVRIDTDCSHELALGALANGEKRPFFIEYASGWTCADLVTLSKDTVMLKSPKCPCVMTELTVGKDARILGVVDAEIRPLTSTYHSTSSIRGSNSCGRPNRFHEGSSRASLKDLLRCSRLRVGLSFREASAASRFIANTLSDERFFVAASTLSDYETLVEPPRRIQKILTLCVIYGIDFYRFLAHGGLLLSRAGREPMPDELLRRKPPRTHYRSLDDRTNSHTSEHGCFLNDLIERWEEIPLFLRHSLCGITGLKNFSLRDVFWAGGQMELTHPWLTNAIFVTVNRRKKKPKKETAQSLYVILKRDGSYLCGPCILRQGNLVVLAYQIATRRAQQFRNGVDAEVIGEITAILRRLA